MEHRAGRGVLLIVQGDLTRERVDAIVNAANPSLMGGGGVDGAIHRRGGPRILEECREARKRLGGPLPTGEAVLTTGGDLQARHVIHTVGPVYGKDPDPEGSLARAWRRSLALAAEQGFRSVAFPSISTGAYGFPVDQAARIALREVLEHLGGREGPVEEVRIVLFDAPTLEAWEEALRGLTAP